ncbi:MAG TPA: protein phosphatase 2C domain-containing protein, partial [Ktedonobacterales bacterium]|nr:protein phosphatase 2C domain-containing protein [Ktedonobacterales bacterium]
MAIPLLIAGGSVPGRAHLMTGRPNQDALSWVRSERALIGAVCDGCGSGAHSEVGAQLGAQLLVGALHRELAQMAISHDATDECSALQTVLRVAQDHVLAQVGVL